MEMLFNIPESYLEDHFFTLLFHIEKKISPKIFSKN